MLKVMEILNKRKRILVLDKNSRMSSVIDDVLNYGDFEIFTIYDPGYVSDKAKMIKPDLILLDYLLVDDDCVLICRELKNDQELKDTPVIVITAYRTKKVVNNAYQCDALFLKPLDMSILASRIDYLMAS
jgi:DNA-binding response OmpR family regulator